MSNATKCDRCGGFYEDGGKAIRQGWGTGIAEYDLCPDCSTAFDAWMECQPVTDAPERVTNQAEMLHDTREKLEADVDTALYGASMADDGYISLEMAIGWLDRQAAITERECAWRWQQIAEDRDRAEMERDELAQRIKTLELEIAKRDKGIERLKRRRGELTEQLGKMADRMAKDGR